MSVTNIIRHKRFVLKEATLSLEVIIPAGDRITLEVINCSLTGLRANYSGDAEIIEILVPGMIVPSAKLHGDGFDYALGRMVVRGANRENDITNFRFSLIDVKLPIDGKLSKFLAANEGGLKPYDLEMDPCKFDISTFDKNVEYGVDIFSRCHQFSVLFNEWEKTPQYQYRTIRTPSMGTRVNLTLKRKGKRNDFIVMGSNDYLNLAAHPKVREAAKQGIDEYGFGSTGSPLTTGLTRYHEELTELLARIFRKERALLFNSGYTANIGAISGLAREQDLLVADFLVHASIQDAIKLSSSSSSRFFKHNNVAHLESILDKARHDFAGCLVITEGVFSMDGDLPPLDEIVAVAKRHKARVFLDEAHSFGVVGERGLGAANHFQVQSDIDISMGTFSKICGGIGGFVVADKEVIDWLYWFGRSQMFSVSIPPSTAAAALAALKLFLEDHERLARLHANIRQFVAGMRDLGCRDLQPNHPSAVLPVQIRDEHKLGIMNQHLIDNGIFVVPIVYPAVSRNSCRFRFTMMADHSASDIDYALQIFKSAMEKAHFAFAQSDEQQFSSQGLSGVKKLSSL